MSERETSPEELEAFREEIREAIEAQIFIIASGQADAPVIIDPFNLGLTEETLAELEPQRVAIIEEEIYRSLGISPDNEIFTSYTSLEIEDGLVNVFEAISFGENGEEKPIYLHSINHPDGTNDWKISTRPDHMDVYDLKPN